MFGKQSSIRQGNSGEKTADKEEIGFVKIFCTYSSDVKPRGSYEECIRGAGHEIFTGSARELLNADALFICIAGKENREIKENLNLALDRGLSVAYVIEDGGVPDAGLNIQLAIAAKVPSMGVTGSGNGLTGEGRTQNAVDDRTGEGQTSETSERELTSWMTSVGEKVRAGRRKKNIKITVCVLAAAFVISCTVILVSLLTGSTLTQTALPESTTEEQLGIDVDELKSREKIDLSGKGIEDISFLSECTACKELDISDNRVSDISVLSKLSNIRILNVSGNRIKDINVLLTLKNLTEVDLSDNPISDYTATSFLSGVDIKQ